MKNRNNRSKDVSAVFGQDLRKKAEALARERADQTSQDSAVISPEETGEILHELRVHQIELELQNEELRTAQAEIEAGRERYFDLYDLAPVGYCTLSEQGLILEANLTAAVLLDMARGALVKQPISRFILKDDQDIYYLHRKKLFETGKSQECELRLIKLDGTHFWAHLTAIAARAEDGAPVCRVAISDITEHKRAELKIEHLLEEKQLLLQETHHRIKNNLAIVKGILSLQARELDDPNCKKILLDAASRVQSMVVLYNKLYRSDLSGELSIKDFLPPLIVEIMAPFPPEKEIRTAIRIEDFKLPAKTLSSIAIIINECITNSMKHAFKNSTEPLITVQANIKNDTATLIYADNGSGIADQISLQNSDSFGFSLIKLLTEDLHGKMQIDNQNGLKYRFDFPVGK